MLKIEGAWGQGASWASHGYAYGADRRIFIYFVGQWQS